jgi:hypothetical protein
LLRLHSNLGFLSRSPPHRLRRTPQLPRQVRAPRPRKRLAGRRSRALRLELSLGQSLAPLPVRVLLRLRLRVSRPRPPPKFARKRPQDSLARPGSHSARANPPAAVHSAAVRPPSRAARPLRRLHPRLGRRLHPRLGRRSHLRLDCRPGCPWDQPHLPRVRRGRRCSPRLHVQSRHRARRRTQ